MVLNESTARRNIASQVFMVLALLASLLVLGLSIVAGRGGVDGHVLATTWDINWFYLVTGSLATIALLTALVTSFTGPSRVTRIALIVGIVLGIPTITPAVLGLVALALLTLRRQ